MNVNQIIYYLNEHATAIRNKPKAKAPRRPNFGCAIKNVMNAAAERGGS